MAPDDVVLEIRRLEGLIRDDIGQADEVATLLSLLESHLDSFAVALAAVQSLRRILYSFAAEHDLFLDPRPDKKFLLWLEPKLDFFVALLRRCLHGADERMQIVALDSLLDLVAVRCQVGADHNQEFPYESLKTVVTSLIANSRVGKAARVHFVSHYLGAYDDLQFWTLKALQDAFDDVELTLASVAEFDTGDDDEIAHHLFENAILILVQVEIPVGKEAQALVGKFFSPAAKHGKASRAKSHSRALNRAWIGMLRDADLPRDLHRVVLAHVKSTILPSFRQPLVLCDFLTDSYKNGGVATMLALEGLFILIADHNLDYPGFYDDLYASLKPSVFYVKYRERFLALIWKFMRSSYLPSYLVAAFIKKFARLAITSPPSGALFCLAIVFNLLRRFPSCRVLIDRPAAGQPDPLAGQADPFLEAENDPKKSRALDSSLWEVVTMKSHFCPEVSKLASSIESETLPIVDFDLTLYSSFTYESLLSKYRTKRRKVEMATVAPTALFPDSIMQNWAVPI